MEFETEVLDVIERAPGVKSFRFRTSNEAFFKPGQYFFVTIKINGIEKTKHFSFSNSPTEKDYIEFTKRITASEYSNALNNLKKGDWAKLRLPYGAFTFEGEYKKAAFLSGGIGITPFRSICKNALDKGISSDIVLFYSNKTENDIIFKSDFDEMSKAEKGFRAIYTLTAESADSNSWNGLRGYINADIIKQELKDYKERVYYICGPPKMVEGLNNVLAADLSIAKDRIKIENFVGY